MKKTKRKPPPITAARKKAFFILVWHWNHETWKLEPMRIEARGGYGLPYSSAAVGRTDLLRHAWRTRRGALDMCALHTAFRECAQVIEAADLLSVVPEPYIEAWARKSERDYVRRKLNALSEDVYGLSSDVSRLRRWRNSRGE